MPDNTVLNAGTGGDVIATDDIAGVKYQRVKVTFGADGFATDVSATDKLPVTGDFYPATQPVSGPLTDTQLRAAAVPVSGTFFQATQPVSAASLPLPAGAATEATLAARVPANGQALMAASVPVAIASNQSALPVTGTFYQATQPVSGTFWQTTQPVSIATMPSTPVTGTFWQATQPVSGTVNGPTLTKGTQGATGYSTQDLKDAGRTLFSACTVIAGVTAVSTEALLTMVPTRAGVAAATATSQAVTAGKTMRLTDITVGLISTGASVLSGRFALRMNPSGAVTATSPILKIIPIPSGAALAQAGGSITIPLPDGFEFSGTQQFGLTQVCSAATGTVWASIGGNEY